MLSIRCSYPSISGTLLANCNVKAAYFMPCYPKLHGGTLNAFRRKTDDKTYLITSPYHVASTFDSWTFIFFP